MLGTGRDGRLRPDQREGRTLDQITASIETIHEGNLRVLTTRYLSECGCEWVVDMWGNVRRVMICSRDTDDIRELDQLKLDFRDALMKH